MSTPVPWPKIPDEALQQPAQLYISGPRKWRQEEARSHSSSLPAPSPTPPSLGAQHSHQPTPPGLLPGVPRLSGQRVPAARCQTPVSPPSHSQWSRMVVGCVSRIPLFQCLTQHLQSISTSAYVHSLYIPVVNSESQLT